MTFENMWNDLLDVGRSSKSGGYYRQPFGSAEQECAAWFADEANSRGLDPEHDGFGNMVAWWGTGSTSVLTGSHLDSVLDGGAFDGPLGVVSALAAFDELRERGFAPSRRLGIGVFVEEEGSRFRLACLGSQLAVGAIGPAQAENLTDRTGTRLGDAWAAADLDSSQGSGLLKNLECFVELHVEQGRDHLVARESAIGVASKIWPHGRYRFDFTGEANHVGTTRMEDRHDPMLTYAHTALAAAQQAQKAGVRATFGRLSVEPNGTNAIPSRVTAWLDARSDSDQALAELVQEIVDRAGAKHASMELRSP